MSYKLHDRQKEKPGGHGVITERDLFKHETALASDAAFEPGSRQLVDFRHVTNLAVSDRELKELAKFSPWQKGSRRAVAMTNELACELLLIAVSYNRLFGSTSGVYYEIDGAMAWLDEFSSDYETLV